jgi:hypothetical protein
LLRDGDRPGKKNQASFPSERSDVKLARLPDNTVSGRFWEERNARAKVNKTIKIHVEWAVSDCGHVKKKIPNEGDKNLRTFFLERKERFSGGSEKHCVEQRYLVQPLAYSSQEQIRQGRTVLLFLRSSSSSKKKTR